jgi:hypothetical protein
MVTSPLGAMNSSRPASRRESAARQFFSTTEAGIKDILFPQKCLQYKGGFGGLTTRREQLSLRRIVTAPIPIGGCLALKFKAFPEAEPSPLQESCVKD